MKYINRKNDIFAEVREVREVDIFNADIGLKNQRKISLITKMLSPQGYLYWMRRLCVETKTELGIIVL